MLNSSSFNRRGSSARMSKTYAALTSKMYAALVYGTLCIPLGPRLTRAQTTVSGDTDQRTCAALLANDSTAGTHIGPTDPAARARDTTSRSRPDSSSFEIGGARKGPGDVILLVGIHADEVRFAAQPHVRVRLCWGGDTLRVVQRDNLPSPIVPGTTYRNVYIAVELVGRVNAECLADMMGVGTSTAPNRPRAMAPPTALATTSASNCAFLGGSAQTGAQNARPPTQ
jgi:hypothetical protein